MMKNQPRGQVASTHLFQYLFLWTPDDAGVPSRRSSPFSTCIRVHDVSQSSLVDRSGSGGDPHYHSPPQPSKTQNRRIQLPSVLEGVAEDKDAACKDPATPVAHYPDSSCGRRCPGVLAASHKGIAGRHPRGWNHESAHDDRHRAG
ncbi:MAG: hypothetical protein HW407_1890 [Bacteroidetes bacterium]|nr:hypothetical protein [Bacteroidota bacterium]